MANYTSVMNVSETQHLGYSNINAYPETIVIINCGLNAPLMLISITANSLVLAVVFRTPSLRSPSTIFLCSLAVSDLLVGLVVQPLYISFKLKAGDSLKQAYNMLALPFCGVSLGTMTAISEDRFLDLHFHMRYLDLMTEKRSLYATVTIWSFFLLLSCIYMGGPNVFFLTIVVLIVICLFLSIFSYVSIYRIVRQHRIQIHAQQQAVQQSFNTEYNLNTVRSKKSAINAFIYYICMILCYFPLLITSLTRGILPIQDIDRGVDFATTVTFMNSSINPFLYCWRNRKLRKAIFKTLRNILFKQTEGN